jgi:hypothetical protein
MPMGLFSFVQNLIFFQDFSLHRIFGHMHKVLNVDANKN